MVGVNGRGDFMEWFDFDSYIRDLVENYQGDAVLLGNAIGALVLGRYVGWRVLRLMYSAATYTKYQRILGLQFKAVLPERGRYAYKSLGLNIIDKVGGFWDFVRRAAGPPELKEQHHLLS